MRPVAAFLCAVVAALLCGCAGLSAADRAPRTDPVGRLTPAGPSPWTEDLGDPALHALLAQADAGALDVKVALAHLEQADGELEAAEAVGRLRITVGAAAALGGGNLHTARSAGTPTLETTYDLDLWHRFARGRMAAREGRTAAEWDLRAARLLVGAETVRTYAALQAARDAEASAGRRQADQTAALGFSRLRLAQGAATAREIVPRLHALAAANAQAEQARAEIALQAARLRDLTGQRDFIAPPAASLTLRPAPGGTASDQVDTRPDVQAAFARLLAADQRRTAAVLETRPQFQIASAVGAPDAAIATLLDVRSLAWAVAGMAAHEVLDGGARRAHVHIASAEADLADLGYRKAVLSGWSEMRGALAGETNAGRQVVLAEADLDAARSALSVGETRHAAGAADGLTMSDLAEQVETANDALRAARLQALEARVRRVLSTGGR